ncbi:cytochrome P450 3A11-like [Oppia nitens]|uniref:cytochrome P450 3A11-like n=1 Tax=Oppia nitens TaxID=1686743 RepID=UPI0023DB083A|nr:cytochrome P450 3A11-like [Oppia nitens]
MSILLTITDYLGPIQLAIITILVSVLTYNYFKWKRLLSYWSSRNVSGPKPLPVFGNFLAKFFIPKPYLELQWYRQFGRLFGTYTGDKPDLTVADPELIKQIMVKDFHRFRNRRDNGSSRSNEPIAKNMFSSRDDTWKRIRAIASPTFTSGKLRKLYTLIGQCCDEFVGHLDGKANRRESIELKKSMGDLTMDVIARCAFATKPNTYTDPDDRFTRSANSLFTIPVWRIILMAILPTRIRRLPPISRLLRGTAGPDFFVNLGRKLMAHRRETQAKHNDFLQLLMDVEHNPNNNNTDSSVEHRESSGDLNEAHHVNEGADELLANREALSNVLAKRLTEDEILGQCFLFFIAGYETTATTLSFCTYELALNPRLQDRLYDEINGAVNQQNGKLDYEVLSSLPFIDSLISETLRKYPPLLRLEREAMEDIKLMGGDDSTGSIQLEKGTVCEIPVYAIHHDPEYYPEPDRFNPDRFMPDNRPLIKPYTYLPFGVGPRNCIGMRFALLEAKLALAKLVQVYRFSRVGDTDVPLVYNRGRDLMQARRLVVGIEKRVDAGDGIGK